MSLAKAVTLMFCISVVAVLVFAAGGPVKAAVSGPRKLSQVSHTYRASVPPHPPSPPPPPPLSASPPPPPPSVAQGHAAGTTSGAPATPAMCGTEPHMDPQGHAVVDGRGHHKETAAECCEACATHAQKHPNNKPCNSWVFCPLPHCWSADNGNTHLFGECWLKWQSDPKHPLYGQRGRYTEEYRRRNRDKHLNGAYPTDKISAEIETRFGILPGSRRNLTVPTHVVWIGGVLGAPVDLSVEWTTDADGTMRSSKGDVIVDYRPWESREQNLRRGVKPEQMKF